LSNFKNPIRIIHTDFRLGEVDPLMKMRHDTGSLPSGAQSMTNMLVSQIGPASRRPGMAVVATLPERARLVEFEFDIDEKYIVAFSAGTVHIYNPDGSLATTLSSSIFTATSIWELTFIQKGDVMLIAHNSFKTRRIKRTGLSSFVLETIAFSTDTGDSVLNQPYMKYQPASHTMAISDVTVGTGKTLTSNPGYFTAAMVGERIRIYNCEIEITAFTSATSVEARNRQKIETRLGVAPLRFTQGTKDVEVTHVLHGLATGASITLSGAAASVDFTTSELNGTYVITVLDEDRYQITVTATDTANESSDGGGPSIRVTTTDPTRSWTEQVWSDRRGWPGAITLHENRLWLGGSKGNPTFLSGSAVGSYYDHNVRDGLDDESVQGQISTLSRIIHLVSTQMLQIFTEASEAVAETQNGQPVTPSNFKVTSQTNYGASIVRPLSFDGATLFSQRNGKNVREMLYDYNTDSHVSSPVSIASSHLINTPRDLAVLMGTPNRPEQYAFFVNSNGSVAVFQSIRNEKLAAWTPMSAGGGGKFDSVCVIVNSTYFSVLHGSTYTLERFELDVSDIWLDHARVMSGSASTVWALGSVYAGTEVEVMSRNNYIGSYLANGSGTITLPFSLTAIVAGFDYPVELVPQPPDKELTDGPMTGEIRRIVSATVHWHQSTAVAINGQEQLHFNPIANPASQALRKSGKRRVRLLGYSRDPAITITQPTPGPLTVLGMSLEVSL
jgi:hypothetical protein